jgi:phospholipase/lecithinase/hemolysin
MRYWNTALSVAFVCVLGSCSSGGDSGDGAPVGTAAGSSTSAASGQASAMLVLGDSLSDVGNAAAAIDFMLSPRAYPPTVGLCNPHDVLVLKRSCDDLFYRQSRVSNGPVAVEYLAQHFGVGELEPSLHFLLRRPVVGTDYAVAGAKARGSRQGDLGRQIDVLLRDIAPRRSADAVYVVMIGSNDAIDALQTVVDGAPNAHERSAAIVTAAVGAIGKGVERLLGAGARRLLIANVPDLAMLPAVRTKGPAGVDRAAVLHAASAVTDEFDRALDATLDQIIGSGRWPSISLTRFDLRAAWRAADTAAAAEGKNTVDACFDSEEYRHSATAERDFNSGCAPIGGGPPRFSEFAFWDDLHPTRAVHAAIGAALVAAFRR